MKKNYSLFFGTYAGTRILRLLLAVVISLLAGFPLFAQVRVTGVITDETQKPLRGVSVLVKGTNNGTTTDENGGFVLSVPGTGSVLVISHVGYGTIEQRIGTNTTLNLSLSPSGQSALNEVVVIGYGTAAKRDLTGSITKIAGREVADKPNANPVASLQGKVAGLSVVNSGTPGQQPDIRIRGTVSIGQVNPLYVVDGIFQDNINYLNPNDIESIEVLKDPSSLAIFGVRGATGVIAITTKKARAGQVVVNFNTSYGFKNLVDKIQMANADQFKQLFAQERANNGITTPYDFTGLTADTDWIDAVTRTGKFSNNNLSISGSSERNRFNFGLGYLYDEGIIKHEQLSRITLSLNDELRVSNAFRIGVNLNASRQRNPYGAGWVLDAARKVIPLHSAETRPFRVVNPYNRFDTTTIDMYSALDVGLQSSGVINPLVVLENEWDKTRGYEYRTVGSVFGEITFLRDFTFRSTVYADISNVNTRVYTPLYYAYNPRTSQPELYSQNTRVGESDETWRKFQQDHVLTYKKNFGDHGLTATGGFTTYYFGFFGRYGNASPFTGITGRPIPNDPRFWYVNSGYQDPTKTSASSGQSEYTTVSYLARALYNYRNRYFLNLSFRDDASSRIPELNRHQKFWAVGAAWDPLKESFMQNVTFFSSLRLKGSVGVLGNQTASRLDGSQLNYPFYPNLRTGTAAVFDSVVHRPADIEYIPNPDLRWESVAAQEIGVELTAFSNRLRFEFNYFNKTTRDLMTYVSRGSLGLKDKLINGGKIRNWGQEVSASWNQSLSRDFNFNVSGNITFLKNEVLELSEELPAGVLIRGFQNNGSAEARTLPGYPIGSFFGYVVEGIYQSQVDILKSPPASALGSYRPGDFKFKDVDGNGIIDANDRTVIGNPTPDFTYGASVNLNYKGFSLGLDVNGVYGNEIFRTWGSLESPFQRVNYAAFQAEAWNGPGTSNWVPLVSQADRVNYNGSTYNIEDGSYFRIRNLQLGYNFDRNFLNRLRMSNLRVYINVQNLKTWKNNQGYTPEFGGGATAFGFDDAGGAIPRVTTLGLNVTF
ncbi:MAG TPA: TonB-dependent receptor [Flavisolibacter sp.]|jgi:TonB-linked SusC/RagA family outer membrane protein|nr:TonB-dependent receptor [Flavisolibacter sp.]